MSDHHNRHKHTVHDPKEIAQDESFVPHLLAHCCDSECEGEELQNFDAQVDSQNEEAVETTSCGGDSSFSTTPFASFEGDVANHLSKHCDSLNCKIEKHLEEERTKEQKAAAEARKSGDQFPQKEDQNEEKIFGFLSKINHDPMMKLNDVGLIDLIQRA